MISARLAVHDRKGFFDEKLSVEIMGPKMILNVGSGRSCLSLDLYECVASESKTEIQEVLFLLCDKTVSIKSELEMATRRIEHLQAQKSQGATSAFLDLERKNKNPGRAKPNKVGMSVVNPTSRKRKAATGVVFD